MGQYFLIVNVTKKEYLNPHNLGGGLKLWEICANSTLNVLGFLLRKSSEGGGGDIHKNYSNAGRWAGDRIFVVGDYDDSKLYDKASGKFKEISQEIREEWNEFIEHNELKIPREGYNLCPICGKSQKREGDISSRYYCDKCNDNRIKIKDASRDSLMNAMEFGYKQHEKGHNLQKARSDMLNIIR